MNGHVCHPGMASIGLIHEGSQQAHKLSFIYSDDKMIKDIENVFMQSDNANG